MNATTPPDTGITGMNGTNRTQVAGPATAENAAISAPPAQHAVPDTAVLIRRGYLFIAGFIVTLVAWSAFTALPAATLAAGTVVVSGSNKNVQHAEGGIVARIHVRDGDVVEQGQPLVTLASNATQALRDTTWMQRVRAEASWMRARSEALDSNVLVLSPWAEQNRNDPLLAEAIRDEEAALLQSRSALQSRIQALQGDLRQNQQDHAGHRRRQINLQTQYDSVTRELAEYQRFLQSGIVTRRQIFELEHRQAALRTDLDDNAADLAMLAERAAGLEAELAGISSSSRTAAAQDAARWRREADELSGRLAVLEEQLNRTLIRAPIAGTVVGSSISTEGGVVAPGAVMMSIVPSGTALVVKAQVDPKDRETLLTGQPARIRFTGLSQRFSRPVDGEVAMISADRVTESTGPVPKSFYDATIVLPDDAAAVAGIDRLYPGMQAEVVIETGERTVLEYLVQPLVRGFNRSLRES